MNKVSQLLLLAVMVLAACSKKTTVTTTSTPSTYVPVASVAIEEVNFDYLHGKARMVFKEGNNEREVRANIRIRKDSVIWMNFDVVGIQGGRVLINKDSITVINNVKKEYYVFSYGDLSKKFRFDINYDAIQSVMLGNLIHPKSERDSVEQKSATLLLSQNSGTVQILNFISAANMKIQKVELKETNTHNAVTINYGNFQPVGDKLFPYDDTITIFYKTAAGLLNTAIIFEYTKAEVGDKQLRFPFNIPKKYERK